MQELTICCTCQLLQHDEASLLDVVVQACQGSRQVLGSRRQVVGHQDVEGSWGGLVTVDIPGLHANWNSELCSASDKVQADIKPYEPSYALLDLPIM